MSSNLDALKKKFRDGHHAEAIADAEQLCAAEPANREARRLTALMNVVARRYGRALELLRELRDPLREDPDLLFNLAMCERELQDFAGAARDFQAYVGKFPAHADGWASLADCRLQLGELDACVAAANMALQLDANCVPARVLRADALQAAGRGEEAVKDYEAALAVAPGDEDTLKKATYAFLELGRAQDGIELCRRVLRTRPDNLTAKLGAEWLLSQLVPIWHVPMMNEPQRNQAYHDGIAAAVMPGDVVFEIGAGSGLLAMMAARAGAKSVVTCEAVPLIAQTARKIVARNRLQDQVTVLAKTSQQVKVGADLPTQADVLVHEIFSSELLGEHVLPAIEDAKRRLLKPGGRIVPGVASIMIALVGGEQLGKSLHVEDSFGFDLSGFNAIHPRRRPLYREDLNPLLMSDAVEAFRFDFMATDVFAPEKKRLELVATQAGACYGVIQWIRLEMAKGDDASIIFENHPAQVRPVSNWQHTVYGFEAPLALQPGAKVNIAAMHDRSRPWFERVT
jgi:tetratricopeptide (TPR) repeat protein